MCCLTPQGVLDLVIDSYTVVATDATEAQRNTHRETRKKDHKSLIYIHQCVDTNVFEKSVDSTMTNAVWDTLVQCYGGDACSKRDR